MIARLAVVAMLVAPLPGCYSPGAIQGVFELSADIAQLAATAHSTRPARDLDAPRDPRLGYENVTLYEEEPQPAQANAWSCRAGDREYHIEEVRMREDAIDACARRERVEREWCACTAL